MSGLMLMHNWFPDPYLTGTVKPSVVSSAEWAYWDSPYPMLNVRSKDGDYHYVEYRLAGLPPGIPVRLSAFMDASETTVAFNPLMLLTSQYEVLDLGEQVSGVTRTVTVDATVPSDGVLYLRFYSTKKTGEQATYSRVMLTEAGTYAEVDRIIPAAASGGVFGYALMPDPRS